MSGLIDRTSNRYGLLTVLSRGVSPRRETRAYWLCQCDCGARTTVSGSNLQNGHTTSCGCQKGNRTIIHGGSRREKRAPEYNVWCKMRDRCSNPKNQDFKNYGGRGIAVCDRWITSFAAFLSDMGPRPSDVHTIERKDNDKGYSPDNCIWATRSVQAFNRRQRPNQTHCKNGHAMEGDNVYLRPDGKRGCRECRQKNMRDFYERKRTAA